MRLTERQQLALALEESLKASQPQPQASPSKNNNTGSGESSATRVRHGSTQPAQLRHSSSDAAKRLSEKASTSQAPVRRTLSAAGSDTESSAGPSRSHEPSFAARRDTAKSQPSSTAPSRKRKHGAEGADDSSSCQCGDQSLNKDQRIRVEVDANAFSGPEKETSFSDTSRHSHSTSLPSTPRVGGHCAVLQLGSLRQLFICLDSIFRSHLPIRLAIYDRLDCLEYGRLYALQLLPEARSCPRQEYFCTKPPVLLCNAHLSCDALLIGCAILYS